MCFGRRYGYYCSTSDGLLKTGPGIVHAVVITGGSDNGSIVVYDNTELGGDILAKIFSNGANLTNSVVLDAQFSKGLYVDIGGNGGPRATVTFA